MAYICESLYRSKSLFHMQCKRMIYRILKICSSISTRNPPRTAWILNRSTRNGTLLQDTWVTESTLEANGRMGRLVVEVLVADLGTSSVSQSAGFICLPWKKTVVVGVVYKKYSLARVLRRKTRLRASRCGCNRGT
jgi:hypothetical protein